MIRGGSTTRRRLYHPVSLRARRPRPKRHDPVPAPDHRGRGGFLTPRLYPEALWDDPTAVDRGNLPTPRL